MQQTTVVKVHDYNTFTDLISSGLTVVDYSATWCGPCKKIAPIYELIATEYTKVIPEGLQFIKVDVDEVQEAAKGVAGLPTFQFWVDGNRVDDLTFMGANVDKLKGNIGKLLRGEYKIPNSSTNTSANSSNSTNSSSSSDKNTGLKLKKKVVQHLTQAQSDPVEIAPKEEPIRLDQEF